MERQNNPRKKGTNPKPKETKRLVDYKNLERNVLNEIAKEFEEPKNKQK